MGDFENKVLAVLRDLTESIDALTDALHDCTYELDDVGDGLHGRV